MNIDDITKQAVSQQIAASVIEKLPTEHRDAIMRAAVEQALKSYSYRSAVEEAVCKEAARIAESMLSEIHWQTHISDKVEASIRGVMSDLCESIPEAMLAVFGGREDRYNRGPGLIHALLADKLEARKLEARKPTAP